ncbi:MAG: S9 family peptidase [Bryobacteraceae bacterium]
MIRRILFSLLSIPCAFADPWTIDAILGLRSIVDFQLSPDGAHLIYVTREVDWSRNAHTNSVWLVLAQAGTPVRVRGGHPSDSRPRWSPDGKQIAFLSSRDGKPQVYVSDPSGGTARKITQAPTGVSSFHWSPDGRQIGYLSVDPVTAEEQARHKKGDDVIIADKGYKYTRLYATPVASWQPRLVVKADRHVMSFDWSPDSRRIVYAAQPTPRARDMFQCDIFEVEVASGADHAVVRQEGRDGDPAYTPDGRSIVFHSQGGTINYFAARHIALVPSAGGKIRYLTSKFEGDVFRGGNQYAWSPDGKRMVFAAGKGTHDDLYSMDVETGAAKVVAASLAGTGFSTSRDLSMVATLRMSNDAPPDLFVNGKRVTQVNPQVAGLPSLETQTLRWKSKDGMDVEGVLRLPVGHRKGQKVPLLVELHGGPTGVALEGYPMPRTYPTQVLAQMGFAIFAPNFRGSSNYGEKFRLANIQSQGFGDADDMHTGIDLLIKEGVADPDRLGVMGWSYGGYLTSFLIGVTHRFKAAAIGATAADWTGYYGVNTGPPETLWTYFGGKPWDHLEAYARHSPRTRLRNAKTPTLLAHGALDFDSTMEIYRALSDLGVPHEFVTYPREGHGIAEPMHQKDLMERHARWFSRWVLGR